jgi:hypothetical protein
MRWCKTRGRSAEGLTRAHYIRLRATTVCRGFGVSLFTYVFYSGFHFILCPLFSPKVKLSVSICLLVVFYLLSLFMFLELRCLSLDCSQFTRKPSGEQRNSRLVRSSMVLLVNGYGRNRKTTAWGLLEPGLKEL